MLESLDAIAHWLPSQRWYANKSKAPHVSILGRAELSAASAEGRYYLLVLRDTALGDTVYQVPLSVYGRRIDELQHAEIDTVMTQNGAVWLYDAPHDPAFVQAILQMAEGASGPASKDEVTDAVGLSGEPIGGTRFGTLRSSEVLRGEQSNTSIICDTDAGRVMTKIFRTISAGVNPDVELQEAIAANGSDRVPKSLASVTAEWRDPREAGSNGEAARVKGSAVFIQEFLPGVRDAWRVALEAADAGTAFEPEARDLGVATREVHDVLARAVGTTPTDDETVDQTLRGMRDKLASVVSEVPALAEFEDAIAHEYEAARSAAWPARQRVHGDFHLGQVLLAPGRGWVLLDFEGEPLRPLAERIQPDFAVRDVAGLLRSLDYVAGSLAHQGKYVDEWAGRMRAAFLDGYGDTDPQLVRVFEIDKAVYEVLYEARNRPAWLGIPLTAIRRLVGDAR